MLGSQAEEILRAILLRVRAAFPLLSEYRSWSGGDSWIGQVLITKMATIGWSPKEQAGIMSTEETTAVKLVPARHAILAPGPSLTAEPCLNLMGSSLRGLGSFPGSQQRLQHCKSIVTSHWTIRMCRVGKEEMGSNPHPRHSSKSPNPHQLSSLCTSALQFPGF